MLAVLFQTACCRLLPSAIIGFIFLLERIAKMSDFRQDFLKFALEQNVLKFGEFTTKAGRQSPYFFNAGLFNDGASTLALAKFYAQAIIESKVEFDMLFGPAYKGIILAAATAMMLAENGVNVPFAYNRKEAKDHGEGGVLVGAPLKGRVLIIDDVISAGTSVRESVKLIEAEGATPAAVAIALDRMEKGTGELSAVQEVEQQYGLPVVAIANLRDLLALLENNAEFGAYLEPVRAYRERYGVA
ncbi:orotate phosphoribosyltransferase [Neisseria animaloris]|uniref:Orotate phosphoribosyltransferase n=2 Tax=Neisseria TaxID=482 RepID=A0A3S4ZAX0_9NEIS|nr:orotate phosphoribosyltransferase [Neisseria animaloris]